MKTLTVARPYAAIAQKVIKDTDLLNTRLEQINAITWRVPEDDEDIQLDVEDNFDMAGIPEEAYDFEE